MENKFRQKSNSTGDIFTFPAMSNDIKLESELADQLFANGKLLLHAFPVQPANCIIPRSMMLSRTSSISSKSSLMSSRSNSTNSRSSSISISTSTSSCSSARTSTSESSSRRKLITVEQSKNAAIKTINTGTRFSKKECQTRYGDSQRWQFIAPLPVLNRRNSVKKRNGGNGKREGSVGKGFWRRFFGWIVATCQECHAIEPSKRLKVSM